MAGYAIRVEARRLKRHLRESERAARNMTDAFRDIGEETLRSINATFDAEGRPQRWEPLAPSTLTRKVGGARRSRTRRGGLRRAAQRRLAGNKILTATGRLRRSITYRARRDHVIVGSKVIYARAHQLGSPKTNLPARPFLVVQAEDRRRFRRIIARHITRPFR